MKSFTPDQVRAMSLAEATIIIDGFMEMKRAEAGGDRSAHDDHPTLDEVYDLMALHPDT